MSSRMRMVSNSTLARETRMSPAITKPLSRIRSRMSIRFVVPATVGTRSIRRVSLYTGYAKKHELPLYRNWHHSAKAENPADKNKSTETTRTGAGEASRGGPVSQNFQYIGRFDAVFKSRVAR